MIRVAAVSILLTLLGAGHLAYAHQPDQVVMDSAHHVLLANGYPPVSYNGLGMQPILGWNTWNTFACNISEDLIMSSAKALIETGLAKADVLIDDCWQGHSREFKTNKPLEDRNRFPSGLKSLTDKIHKLGLKVGIYSSAGSYTCAGRFGSLDFEEIDAQQYSDWGFDYLKYDNCWNEGRSGTAKLSYDRYKKMSDALLATSRPIFYSICNWGDDYIWNWGSGICNSWRMSGDIYDNFDTPREECPCATSLSCSLPGYFCSVSNIVDKAAPLLQKSIPGSWADLDMLEVGHGGMTTQEYLSHYSLWAMMKSPLILGNDIRDMDEMTLAIITNQELLKIHQEPGGRTARRLWGKAGEMQLWKGDITSQEGGRSWIVGLFNFEDTEWVGNLWMSDIFRDEPVSVRESRFHIIDLWAVPFTSEAEDVVQGTMKNIKVESHGCKVWKFIQAEKWFEDGKTEEEREEERVRNEL